LYTSLQNQTVFFIGNTEYLLQMYMGGKQRQTGRFPVRCVWAHP